MDEKKTKQNWIQFLSLCRQTAESTEKFIQLLDFFLTPEEKEMLSSRYLIIKELLKGELTQREIAKKHKVSIAQITRGSNALKTLAASYKKFLKEHL